MKWVTYQEDNSERSGVLSGEVIHASVITAATALTPAVSMNARGSPSSPKPLSIVG